MKIINNPVLGLKKQVQDLDEDLKALGLTAKDLDFAKNTNLSNLKENFFKIDEEDEFVEYESKWQDCNPVNEVTMSGNVGGGFPAGGPFVKNEYPVLRRSPLKTPKKKNK